MLVDIGIRSQACTRGCASQRILKPSKLYISFASHRIGNKTYLPRSVGAAIRARNSDEEQELIRQEELSDGSTLFVFGSHDDAEAHASTLKPNAAKSEASTATDESNEYETSAVTNSSDGPSQEAPTSIPAAIVEPSGADAVGTEHLEESSGAVLESRTTDAGDGSQHTARAGDNATDLEAARPSKSPNNSNIQSRDSLAELKVAELKELCREKGILGYSKLRKSDLIAAICASGIEN